MARQGRNITRTNPLDVARASNTSSTKKTYKQRRFYDTVIVPDITYQNTTTKTWTSDRFYGTTNNRGNSVLPKLTRLKSLPFVGDASQTEYALDFVVDAWFDFASRLKQLADENIIYRDSPWAKPIVVKAWQPISSLYDDYLRNDVYPVFYDNFMNSNNNDSKTRNFTDFVSRVDEFLQSFIKLRGPITLSGFMESNKAPIYSSGLIIEISSENYDNDRSKSTKFIDENFPLISRIASQYGFLIDKNIPWRLVADLSNPAMIEYMLGVPLEDFISSGPEVRCEPLSTERELPPMAFGYSQISGLESVRRTVAYFSYEDSEGNRQIEPGYERYKRFTNPGWSPVFNRSNPSEAFESLFETDYTETFYSDMLNFENYLLEFYNYYITLRPVAAYQKLASFSSTCGPIKGRQVRSPMTREDFRALYSDQWRLKTFYILRLFERSIYLTEDNIKVRSRNLQEIMNYYNSLRMTESSNAYEQTLDFVQNTFIGPPPGISLTLDNVGDILFGL